MEIIFYFVIKLQIQLFSRTLLYLRLLIIRDAIGLELLSFGCSWCLIIFIGGCINTTLFVWVFTKQGIHVLNVFNLGPHEVNCFHFILITWYPPKSVFEKASDHNRVITLTYEIFVHVLYTFLVLLFLFYQFITNHFLRCSISFIGG